MNDELTLLKERAATLGINHSPNIGIEALRKKVDAALNDEPEAPEAGEESGGKKAGKAAREETPQEARARIRNKMMTEEMALVRVRLANLNPQKADLQGEFVTFANKYLGTHTKFIPFGEATDNGYHIEKCLLGVLKERMFNQVKTKPGPNGTIEIHQKMVPEYAIEILPPLTKEELDQLARQQAAAQGL
jgi:hypothetical protein